MKSKIRSISIILLISITFCKENSVITEIEASIFQIPGCQPAITKITNNVLFDSCFNYTFLDKLTIDFCINGNCCPDSNRFLITHNIFKDTITIALTDIAPNLCRCICNYIIHGEFNYLSNDSYYIKCIINKGNNKEILYNEKVFKSY